jgi:hypothetical protein
MSASKVVEYTGDLPGKNSEWHAAALVGGRNYLKMSGKTHDRIAAGVCSYYGDGLEFAAAEQRR